MMIKVVETPPFSYIKFLEDYIMYTIRLTHLQPQYINRVINKDDKINFVIDFSNSITLLYREDVINDILHYTLSKKSYDVIVGNIILQILYILKHYPNANIYLFYDTGKSSYHSKIQTSYKATRKQAWSILSPDQVVAFYDLLKVLKELLYELLNSFPRVYVFHLKYMESDFIPYYIFHSGKYKENTEPYILFSSDKDMFQLFQFENLLNIIRNVNNTKKPNILDAFNFLHVFTDKEYNEELIKYYYKLIAKTVPVALATAGDNSDNINGVPRYGVKTFYNKLFNYLSRTHLDENIEELDNSFQIIDWFVDEIDPKLKTYKDLLRTNIKLTDYSIICENLPLSIYEQLNMHKQYHYNKNILDIESLKYVCSNLFDDNELKKSILLTYDNILETINS